MLLVGIVVVFAYLLGMLAIVQIKKDSSIGNFTWGGGVMIVTLYTFFTASTYFHRQILVTALICCWCIRLASYVYLRYKKGADPRYVAWQQERGFLYTLLFNIGWIVFAQSAMILCMSLPSIVINISPAMPGLLLLDLLGTCIWLAGFCIESIADYQLYVFTHQPHDKNAVLSTGLWHYSRHPNYFGEMLMWWGVFCIALSVPYGIYAIIAPLTITILLRYVTGVPWLEKTFENNPAYQVYKNKTSTIIPWFPKT